MRLIDADHVLKALSGFNDYEHGNWHFLSGIETAREIIDVAPTVDPVNHGHWITFTDQSLMCSACSSIAPYQEDYYDKILKKYLHSHASLISF